MKKLKKHACPVTKGKLKLLNVKTNPEELKMLKRLAGKYTKGNLSAWIRKASVNYIPR